MDEPLPPAPHNPSSGSPLPGSPLGLKHPLLPPHTLGHQRLPLQFFTLLGARTITGFDGSLFGSLEVLDAPSPPQQSRSVLQRQSPPGAGPLSAGFPVTRSPHLNASADGLSAPPTALSTSTASPSQTFVSASADASDLPRDSETPTQLASDHQSDTAQASPTAEVRSQPALSPSQTHHPTAPASAPPRSTGIPRTIVSETSNPVSPQPSPSPPIQRTSAPVSFEDQGQASQPAQPQAAGSPRPQSEPPIAPPIEPSIETTEPAQPPVEETVLQPQQAVQASYPQVALPIQASSGHAQTSSLPESDNVPAENSGSPDPNVPFTASQASIQRAEDPPQTIQAPQEQQVHGSPSLETPATTSPSPEAFAAQPSGPFNPTTETIASPRETRVPHSDDPPIQAKPTPKEDNTTPKTPAPKDLVSPANSATPASTPSSADSSSSAGVRPSPPPQHSQLSMPPPATSGTNLEEQSQTAPTKGWRRWVTQVFQRFSSQPATRQSAAASEAETVPQSTPPIPPSNSEGEDTPSIQRSLDAAPQRLQAVDSPEVPKGLGTAAQHPAPPPVPRPQDESLLVQRQPDVEGPQLDDTANPAPIHAPPPSERPTQPTGQSVAQGQVDSVPSGSGTSKFQKSQEVSETTPSQAEKSHIPNQPVPRPATDPQPAVPMVQRVQSEDQMSGPAGQQPNPEPSDLASILNPQSSVPTVQREQVDGRALSESAEQPQNLEPPDCVPDVDPQASPPIVQRTAGSSSAEPTEQLQRSPDPAPQRSQAGNSSEVPQGLGAAAQHPAPPRIPRPQDEPPLVQRQADVEGPQLDDTASPAPPLEPPLSERPTQPTSQSAAQRQVDSVPSGSGTSELQESKGVSETTPSQAEQSPSPNQPELRPATDPQPVVPMVQRVQSDADHVSGPAEQQPNPELSDLPSPPDPQPSVPTVQREQAEGSVWPEPAEQPQNLESPDVLSATAPQSSAPIVQRVQAVESLLPEIAEHPQNPGLPNPLSAASSQPSVPTVQQVQVDEHGSSVRSDAQPQPFADRRDNPAVQSPASQPVQRSSTLPQHPDQASTRAANPKSSLVQAQGDPGSAQDRTNSIQARSGSTTVSESPLYQPDEQPHNSPSDPAIAKQESDAIATPSSQHADPTQSPETASSPDPQVMQQRQADRSSSESPPSGTPQTPTSDSQPIRTVVASAKAAAHPTHSSPAAVTNSESAPFKTANASGTGAQASEAVSSALPPQNNPAPLVQQRPTPESQTPDVVAPSPNTRATIQQASTPATRAQPRENQSQLDQPQPLPSPSASAPTVVSPDVEPTATPSEPPVVQQAQGPPALAPRPVGQPRGDTESASTPSRPTTLEPHANPTLPPQGSAEPSMDPVPRPDAALQRVDAIESEALPTQRIEVEYSAQRSEPIEELGHSSPPIQAQRGHADAHPTASTRQRQPETDSNERSPAEPLPEASASVQRQTIAPTIPSETVSSRDRVEDTPNPTQTQSREATSPPLANPQPSDTALQRSGSDVSPGPEQGSNSSESTHDTTQPLPVAGSAQSKSFPPSGSKLESPIQATAMGVPVMPEDAPSTPARPEQRTDAIAPTVSQPPNPPSVDSSSTAELPTPTSEAVMQQALTDNASPQPQASAAPGSNTSTPQLQGIAPPNEATVLQPARLSSASQPLGADAQSPVQASALTENGQPAEHSIAAEMVPDRPSPIQPRQRDRNKDATIDQPSTWVQPDPAEAEAPTPPTAPLDETVALPTGRTEPTAAVQRTTTLSEGALQPAAQPPLAPAAGPTPAPEPFDAIATTTPQPLNTALTEPSQLVQRQDAADLSPSQAESIDEASKGAARHSGEQHSHEQVNYDQPVPPSIPNHDPANSTVQRRAVDVSSPPIPDPTADRSRPLGPTSEAQALQRSGASHSEGQQTTADEGSTQRAATQHHTKLEPAIDPALPDDGDPQHPANMIQAKHHESTSHASLAETSPPITIQDQDVPPATTTGHGNVPLSETPNQRVSQPPEPPSLTTAADANQTPQTMQASRDRTVPEGATVDAAPAFTQPAPPEAARAHPTVPLDETAGEVPLNRGASPPAEREVIQPAREMTTGAQQRPTDQPSDVQSVAAMAQPPPSAISPTNARQPGAGQPLGPHPMDRHPQPPEAVHQRHSADRRVTPYPSHEPTIPSSSPPEPHGIVASPTDSVVLQPAHGSVDITHTVAEALPGPTADSTPTARSLDTVVPSSAENPPPEQQNNVDGPLIQPRSNPKAAGLPPVTPSPTEPSDDVQGPVPATAPDVDPRSTTAQPHGVQEVQSDSPPNLPPLDGITQRAATAGNSRPQASFQPPLVPDEGETSEAQAIQRSNVPPPHPQQTSQASTLKHPTQSPKTTANNSQPQETIVQAQQEQAAIKQRANIVQANPQEQPHRSPLTDEAQSATMDPAVIQNQAPPPSPTVVQAALSPVIPARQPQPREVEGLTPQQPAIAPTTPESTSSNLQPSDRVTQGAETRLLPPHTTQAKPPPEDNRTPVDSPSESPQRWLQQAHSPTEDRPSQRVSGPAGEVPMPTVDPPLNAPSPLPLELHQQQPDATLQQMTADSSTDLATPTSAVPPMQQRTALKLQNPQAMNDGDSEHSPVAQHDGQAAVSPHGIIQQQQGSDRISPTQTGPQFVGQSQVDSTATAPEAAVVQQTSIPSVAISHPGHESPTPKTLPVDSGTAAPIQGSEVEFSGLHAAVEPTLQPMPLPTSAVQQPESGSSVPLLTQRSQEPHSALRPNIATPLEPGESMARVQADQAAPPQVQSHDLSSTEVPVIQHQDLHPDALLPRVSEPQSEAESTVLSKSLAHPEPALSAQPIAQRIFTAEQRPDGEGKPSDLPPQSLPLEMNANLTVAQLLSMDQESSRGFEPLESMVHHHLGASTSLIYSAHRSIMSRPRRRYAASAPQELLQRQPQKSPSGDVKARLAVPDHENGGPDAGGTPSRHRAPSSLEPSLPSAWSSLSDLLEPKQLQGASPRRSNGSSASEAGRDASQSLVITPAGLQVERASVVQAQPTGGGLKGEQRQGPTSTISPATEPETITMGGQQDEDNSELSARNFEILAQEIYQALRRRLEIEKERHGWSGQGRLPW